MIKISSRLFHIWTSMRVSLLRRGSPVRYLNKQHRYFSKTAKAFVICGRLDVQSIAECNNDQELVYLY